MRPGSKLLRKSGKSDIETFEELMLDYEKHIYNVAYRMLGNVDDAKDASQEVLIKIYKNINKCREIQALKSWITTITTNTCIDFLRKRKRIYELSYEAEIETDEGSIDIQIPSDEPTPEDNLIYMELRNDLADALAKLPDMYRILIVMRDIYGFSYNEICVAVGIQLGTVKSRLSRARNNLRLLLEQKDITHV